MQKLTTCLTFADRAEEAVKFYVSIFKPSKIVKTLRYGEAGPLAKGTVMLVQFKLAGKDYIALNGGDHFKFTDGFSLSVDCKNQKQIDTTTRKLLAGGGQQLPCGWVKDRFGMFWQVNPTAMTKMLADKNAAKVNRVMTAMLQMHKMDIAALTKAFKGQRG